MMTTLPPQILATGAWGPGPASGHAWWSGVAWRGSHDSLKAFVQGPRNGVPVDLVQIFSPANAPLCHDWSMIAGGPGDSPEALDGTLTTTRGGKQAALIWGDPVLKKTPIAYTIRVIPAGPTSNEDGRNPGIWEEIAKGGFDGVYTMLGRRFAYLDTKNARVAQMIIEPAHEMNGGWYPHSIEGSLADGRGAWQVFPAAWARIVESFREGYLKQSGRWCPYVFCFRPGRCILSGGIRLDKFLPPPGTWDTLGVTSHDNAPAWTTAENPRCVWQPCVDKSGAVAMEGWSTLAGIADRYRKSISILEWAGYPPDSTDYKSGPAGDLYVQAVWDFFASHGHLVAAECFFDRGSTTFTTRPGWAASAMYKRLWGRASAS